MDVHPQSFRGIAYEIQDHLTAGLATSSVAKILPLTSIEQEMRKQYGILRSQMDTQRERMGELLEPTRLTQNFLDVPVDTENYFLEVEVDLPWAYADYMGKPYINFVGTYVDKQRFGFTPVAYPWNLEETVRMNQRPAFAIVQDKLILRKTEESALVDEIMIEGVTTDYFPQVGRGDSWYWKRPWNLPDPAMAGTIKLQTIRVFQGTHIALRPYADRKNNGTDAS